MSQHQSADLFCLGRHFFNWVGSGIDFASVGQTLALGGQTLAWGRHGSATHSLSYVRRYPWVNLACV